SDVDDLAAEPDLLDVFSKDDLHCRYRYRSRSRSPRSRRPSGRSSRPSATYGRSAISRARLTATATCRWWRRQAPVIRRERIFPFSETYRRSWFGSFQSTSPIFIRQNQQFFFRIGPVEGPPRRR